MFVVSLLFIALFSQAFADTDDGLSEMETMMKEQYPIPFKIIDFIRVMLGISKEKMMNFGMKVVETISMLNDLWTSAKEMFQREVPKAANMVSPNIKIIPNTVYRRYKY